MTTKCPPQNVGKERETLHRSLELLGTDHVDLWLIHWPVSEGRSPAMWEAFAEAQREGLARDIGVSNFDAGLIDQVTKATGALPAVNQVKWSPLLFDAGFLEQHRERGVVLEGYSALRGGTLDHPVITRIAESQGRTPAQVIVRWHLQHGVVVIPKSVRADRIRSNADVAGFELTDEEMQALDALGR
jgi:diketogulonate reductase-like aldo/keto reductase